MPPANADLRSVTCHGVEALSIDIQGADVATISNGSLLISCSSMIAELGDRPCACTNPSLAAHMPEIAAHTMMLCFDQQGSHGPLR